MFTFNARIVQRMLAITFLPHQMWPVMQKVWTPQNNTIMQKDEGHREKKNVIEYKDFNLRILTIIQNSNFNI